MTAPTPRELITYLAWFLHWLDYDDFQELFGFDETEDRSLHKYHRMQKNEMDFWMYLDHVNQQKLIDAAIQKYGSMKP